MAEEFPFNFFLERQLCILKQPLRLLPAMPNDKTHTAKENDRSSAIAGNKSVILHVVSAPISWFGYHLEHALDYGRI